LGEGIRHHQAGRLSEAEACYRRVLAVQPDHADALHLLGVIAHQVKRHDIAVDLISRAIRRNGQNPFYFSNLGLALQELGRLDEAVASYDRAVTLIGANLLSCARESIVILESNDSRITFEFRMVWRRRSAWRR
jgi:tetratricopeptide (TPR) repeat protein